MSSVNEIVELQNVLNSAADYYYNCLVNLPDDNHAKAYLLERLYFHRNQIDNYRIGFCGDDGLYDHLTRDLGYSSSVVESSGLFTSRLSDTFKNRLVFPCIDDGNVKGMQGRIHYPYEGIPKYITLRGSKWKMFSPQQIISFDKPLYIVEGIFDVITMNSMGFNSLCFFGTNGYDNQHADFLKKFEKEDIYCIPDADNNQEAYNSNLKNYIKIAESLGRDDLKILDLPTNSKNKVDPDSWFGRLKQNSPAAKLAWSQFIRSAVFIRNTDHWKTYQESKKNGNSKHQRKVAREDSKKADILKVATQLGAEITRCDDRFAYCRCLNPSHNDSNPSCVLYLETNSWWCFGCLADEELIWTTNGIKKIGEVNIGEKVLDINGKEQKILFLNRKQSNTIGIEIFKNDPLVLTLDHKCIFVKKHDFFTRKLTEDIAQNLEIGDFFLTPVINIDNRKNTLNSPPLYQIKKKGKPQKIINSLHINKNIARLIGLWLAEGSCNTRGLRFTFNIKEKSTLAQDVINIVKEEFDIDASFYLYPHRNTCEVVVSNVCLLHLFKFYFNSGAANKKIPYECLLWNIDLQISLLNGYIDGDGCKAKCGDGGSIVATVSQQLAYGIYFLAIQCGHLPSINMRKKRIDKNGIQHKPAWIISLYKTIGGVGNRFYQQIDKTNYFWTPIRNITQNKFTNVTDIEVENTKSFMTKCGVTHNCNRGNSPIDLICMAKEVNFKEALKIMEDMYGD